MVIATVVMIMNPDRPWRDDYFFFVVALAVA
jgi:hypothetical protein